MTIKTFLPAISIILGIIFSQLYVYVFLIKYILMLLLFLAFINLKQTKFYPNTLVVLFANLFLGLITYFLVILFNQELAFLCFMTAIMPTALAAPSMIELLNGNVAYVTISVLLTNIFVALFIPVFVGLIIPLEQKIETINILLSVSTVLILPLVLSWIVRKTSGKLHRYLQKLNFLKFYLWNIMLILATSKAAHFLLEEQQEDGQIIINIALASLIICIFNFSIGKVIGGREFFREASQSLGQKNTMFIVWLSLEFFEPTTALGPMFYLIYHNIYNSYLLIRFNRKKQL